MPSIKTAISFDQPLLTRIDAVADDLDLTRSRLLALAADEFVRRHEKARIRADLNRAYAEGLTPEEKERLRLMRRKHRRLVEGEW
jgi:predicted transcriptional regulator